MADVRYHREQPDVMQKRIAWSLTLCAALMACHRNSPPPDDATPGERVTGADRLGWDQQASDGAQLASFSYAVYLDGVRSELAGVSCGSTSAASGFACSARMPAMSAGNHTLELAAFIVDGGVLESPRSSPLRVTFSPASVTQSAPQWQQATIG